MRTTIHLMLASAAVLLLSGCLPEKRVWWSPKGDRAVVLIKDQLHLVKADGGLGAPLVDATLQNHVLAKTVSWLPDGSGFVCQRVHVIHRWEEARALIPPGEAEAVEAMLPAVLPMLEAAVKLAGQRAILEEIVATLTDRQRTQLAATLRLALERDPAVIGPLLMKLPSGEEIVAGMKEEDSGFEVNELCLLKPDDAGAAQSRALARNLLHPALLPKVSPRHEAIAFLRLDEDGESASLEVSPLDGSNGCTVARKVSAAFDWTPDGRGIVFMSPIGDGGEKLHAIHRITVVQENGALMKPRLEKQPDGTMAEVKGQDRLPDPETLATVITLNQPALQCLADGRVLFAAQPMTLPTLGTGPEVESRLFTISADGKSLQPLPTGKGDLPANLAWFTASPDGRQVAVVESETDAVAVVEVDTGRTQIISPPHAGWQCRTMPAWKSATELTFAALHGASNEPRWMLWTEGAGLHCISQKWPASATEDWLEHKKDESGPASGPANQKPASP